MTRIATATALYANGRDFKDPMLSPVYGDMHGFPPAISDDGTRDLLLSNTVRVHRKLRQAGVEALLAGLRRAVARAGICATPAPRRPGRRSRRSLVLQQASGEIDAEQVSMQIRFRGWRPLPDDVPEFVIPRTKKLSHPS